MRSSKYTEQEFITAVLQHTSIMGVIAALNLTPAGGTYKTIYRNIKKYNLNISHFTGQGHLKGKKNLHHLQRSLSEILVKDSDYSNTNFLRKRLIKENILEDICSRCQISTWQGEKLSLHLDHIDGDNSNNLIENLRLLCPNCHSLTPTYCGRNKNKW